MLIASYSRISRVQFKYHQIMNELKEKGIKVECVAGQENAEKHLSFLINVLK